MREGGAEAFVRELARSIPGALDDEALAALALRLRPFLAAELAGPDRREGLLSASEAARAASVHVETIRRAIRTGQLAIVGRVGRSPRIAPDELRRWLVEAASIDETIRGVTRRPRPTRALAPYSLRAAFAAESGDGS